MKLAGFERYFRVISYLVALSGLFALFASGGVGVLVFSLFLLVSLAAWLLEGTKWQLSERLAVIIVAAAVFGFFLDWKLKLTGSWSDGVFAAAGLARLILFLSAIKLLQKKANKDWIFIYIIAFFQVLLAAGLSISPLYLVTLFAFLFFSTCAIIAFEIRKSSTPETIGKAKKHETGIRRILPDDRTTPQAPAFRLPAVSIVLLAAITIIGLPIFFTLPRGNAAGLGNNYSSSVNVTGFSDSVSLGTIGTLLQSDEIVMRVRIDQNNNDKLNRLLWRGVALDRFDNRTWTKSNPVFRQESFRNDRGLVFFDYPSKNQLATIQTFYLEPLNTNVLFALTRPYAIQGVGPVRRDSEGALLGLTPGNQRISYTVYSDTSKPGVRELRADQTSYKARHSKYLQVPPDIDPRIAELAKSYLEESGATNRFDIAETIEARLQGGFGYSLDMKAGGPQPVADFLFNVKTGHCEYFASAMAMMLRTQGVAARIVNGFQSGDFNETAGVFVVRAQNAHSWVEVYFPETNSWIAFDPTPADSRRFGSGNSFFAAITGYVEALETFWIQYVVAYDGQEQKSLFRSLRDGVRSYMTTGSAYLDTAQTAVLDWWQDLRGDQGVMAGFRAAAVGLAVLVGGFVLLFVIRFLWRVAVGLRLVHWIMKRFGRSAEGHMVGFYKEMERILSKGGLIRQKSQTPVEFATSTGFIEAEGITTRYNEVRFGGYEPDESERSEIESWLNALEQKIKERKKQKRKAK